MSVHSNDGITWSMKLERIGELSTQKKDLVFEIPIGLNRRQILNQRRFLVRERG